MIFEIVYGGWTLIRLKVLNKFRNCKSVPYSMLVTLLDNYLPLSLSIYAVTFKLNKYLEYRKAVVRVWTMFLCFSRRHYNKTPLIWMQQLLYWQKTNPALYDTYTGNIASVDEYRVENTHSIIRGNTDSSDSAEVLSHKAKALFAAKTEQHNFKSVFTPPKNYTFSHQQLTTLKVRAAEVLLEIFNSLCSGQSSDTGSVPQFLTESYSVGSPELPLGYHTSWPPNQLHKCDLPGCPDKKADLPWEILRGCGHSFHLNCLKGVFTCPICRHHLKMNISTLSAKIRQAVYSPDANSTTNQPEDNNNQQVTVQSTNDDQLEKKIKEMEKVIDKMIPPTTETQRSTGIIYQHLLKAIPHCKTCGHECQGHKRPKGLPVQCPACPNESCSTAGKLMLCRCSQHNNSGMRNSLLNPSLGFKTVSTGDIKLIILDSSQGSLSHNMQGSNACTLIATMIGMLHLKKKLPELALPDKIVEVFVEKMQEGSSLYDIVSPMFASVNLDALDAAKVLPIKVSADDIKGITDQVHLTNELKFVCQIPNPSAHLLFVPPDRVCQIRRYLNW